MLEIKEQEESSTPKTRQSHVDLNKYHKRIDDLIEDAEIEAEIEAEKKIRSKNSRMFSISMIGIGFLGLVYFQVNHPKQFFPNESPEKAKVKKTETAEERLSKQVPILKDGSGTPSLPVPTSGTMKKKLTNPFITSSRTKTSRPVAKNKEIKKTTKNKKVSRDSKPRSSIKSTEMKKLKKNTTIGNIKSPASTAKTKSDLDKISAATKNESSRFFVQVGAFGVKKNAEKLLKQLKDKGFSPAIQTRSQKFNRYVITVGNFRSSKASETTIKELASKGFNASLYKNTDKTFSLNIGQFKALVDAQKLQDRLSLKGFLSESRKADVPVKTYIVQMGVFPSREKALLNQEKLNRAGYPKSFLR